MRRYTRFISFSLVVHVAIFLGIYLVSSKLLLKRSSDIKKFEVSLEEAPKEIQPLKTKSANNSQHVRLKTQPSTQNTIPSQSEMGFLVPNYLRDPKAVTEIIPEENVLGGHGETPTFAESLEINRFLDELGRRVDEALKYPEEFVDRGFEGSVQVRIRVSETGELQGPIRQLDSGNHLLAIYTAAAVTAALRKPLPPSLWTKKPVEIAFQVKFQLQSMNLEATNQLRVVSNQIHLHRMRYKEDPLTLAYNKVRKYLVVLPLPGGFWIDFVALYKLVDEWDKPSHDWTQAQRLEILSESLNKMYRAQQPTQTQVGDP